MKNVFYIFLFIIPMMIFSACSDDSNDEINGGEDETTYGLSIHVEQLKSFDITERRTRLYSRVEIFEGKGLEKKDPSENDYAYDKDGKR